MEDVEKKADTTEEVIRTNFMVGAIENPSFEPDEISLHSFQKQAVSPVNGDAKDEPYEPYSHRVIKHPTTNTETLLHLLKGSLGTGILAMPNAFSHSGYVVGFVGTLVIGIVCTYCIHLLIKAEYELCKRKKVPSLTYPAVAEAALLEGPHWCRPIAPYAVHVVNAFLLVYQLGTCCVYVVFVSENIKSVVDQHTGVETSVKVYMTAILLPLILINWIRNLKFLAPFSTIANFITIVSFGIILYYVFREPPSFDGRTAFGNLSEFPLFFGTVLFALEAIGVMLPLENEMKNPSSFGGTTGVLNKGMVVIVVLYVAMGLFGYLQYGENSAGSITLNLPAKTEILAQAVQCTQAFAIFITHAIAGYVAIDIAWNFYISPLLRDSKHKLIWEYVCRTTIVILTYLLAVAVPALDLFISLFGALCLSALGLAFPAIIQSCVWWHHLTPRERFFMSLKNGLLIIVGVFGLVIGTYTSLKEIIKEFS